MKRLKLFLTILTAFWLTPAYANVYWQDSFESGNFNGWSYAQGADQSQGGPGPQYVYVTTPAAAGIPPMVGKYIAHFERPATTSAYPHAKIYKEWTASSKKDQFGRSEDPVFNCGDVSAIYSARFYFPTNYTPVTDWVNIFQFKEEGFQTLADFNAGKQRQDPSWWVNVGPPRSFGQPGTAPVMFINNWGNTYQNYKPKLVPVPLGRWFTLSANLYNGDRIEWYLDGKRFDTSYNSTYPVGRFYAKSNTWIWGLGHYGGIGTLFIDNVGVASLN